MLRIMVMWLTIGIIKQIKWIIEWCSYTPGKIRIWCLWSWCGGCRGFGLLGSSRLLSLGNFVVCSSSNNKTANSERFRGTIKEIVIRGEIAYENPECSLQYN